MSSDPQYYLFGYFLMLFYQLRPCHLSHLLHSSGCGGFLFSCLLSCPPLPLHSITAATCFATDASREHDTGTCRDALVTCAQSKCPFYFLPVHGPSRPYIVSVSTDIPTVIYYVGPQTAIAILFITMRLQNSCFHLPSLSLSTINHTKLKLFIACVRLLLRC